MTLTTEEKAARKRQRWIEVAKRYQSSTYSRKFVAPTFQRMTRAEAAADPRQYVTAFVEGSIRQVERELGQVVCVTCGRVCRWDDHKQVNTGHFLASRRNSILYEEDNVAPQCVYCNLHLSGAQNAYRKWMLAVRGIEVVEHLERLKQQSVSFSKPELVDMRIDFTARLKDAEKRMAETS